VSSLSPIDVLHGELRDASPTLVGNADLLRSVLSGCGDCIKVLDLEGRLIFMSEGGKRVMEVDDFSLLKGCPWPGFWAGEGNAHALAAVASARDGKTARFRGAANTAKGTPRYWDVQVSPIDGDDGKPLHLLSISRDMTEEWNAAELLNAGPDLDLDPKQALALALAVNELATNAAKYGALSKPSGTVDVSWSRQESGEKPAFVWVWREKGGPAVVAPSREGFGTRVIKASLADDFGGTVELGYEPTGFVCTLTAPIENLPQGSLSL
jgi:anti-sigma regulatory factor (Ser/Thr protein kinase)